MPRKISDATRQKNRERAAAWRASLTPEQKAEQKAYMKTYKQENNERIKELNRDYHAANREEKNAYRKQWAIDNPERQRAGQRKWYDKNIDVVRNRAYISKYGISLDQYTAMLTEQANSCAICQTPKPKGNGTFHVDHDHVTGKVRRLLCHACNTSLGGFRDDPELLKKAIQYLESHKDSKK